MLGYEEISGFENVYLEDSFVREITATPAEVSFVVEVVLLEAHPLYQAPRSGEQYAYGAFRISLRQVTNLAWSDQGKRAAVDSTGEKDYGGFDEFSRSDGSWQIAGDWGEMVIVCDGVPTIEHIEGP